MELIINNEARRSSRACPLCAGNNITILADIRSDQIVESSPYYDDSSYIHLGVRPDCKFGISRCIDCRFVFSSQVPDDAFLEKLYGETQALEKSVAIFARPERAAYAFGALSRLLSAMSMRCNMNEQGMLARSLRILDIGCAFGVGSLGLARRYYPYDVTGIEWSQTTRDYLTSQGMAVYRSVYDLPTESSFDGILLNDVLEHLPDPVCFMKQLRKLTHAGTVMWVNVPNFIDWRLLEIVRQIRSGSNKIPRDLNPWEHLSYFSPKTLDALMGVAGFTRMPQIPVNYPIQCETLLELTRTLLRTFRDVLRIYQKRYPNEVSTSAIYSVTTDCLDSSADFH